MISRSLILDRCAAAFELDPDAGVQLLAAAPLLARASRLSGAPAGRLDPADRPYSELQGLGPYRPPLLPYPLQPDGHVLIWGAPAELDPAALAATLALRYPPHHRLGLLALDAQGRAIGRSETTLAGLAEQLADPQVAAHSPAALVVGLPPLAVGDDLRSLDGLAWVVARLYGPAGCPWDRRQTHQSLRQALLEEAHEVLEALDAGDMDALSEELGDLLLSVVSHSEMARQAGRFDLGDVLGQIGAKLIGRHPHVFADLAVSGEGEVLRNWEQIKAGELAAKGRARPGALDGVPASLPALAAAEKLGKKAARAGFAWPTAEHVWAKLREELGELAEAAAGDDPAHTAAELGDCLFVLAILAGWLQVDAESALRETNARFRRRFGYVEQRAAAQGAALADLGLEALLALWREAKAATA